MIKYPCIGIMNYIDKEEGIDTILMYQTKRIMFGFDLLGLVLSIPGLLIALTVHEFAHGYAAYKMGDYTAKYSGRLSLNPMDHLDLWGTLCLLFFHFSWAKPVPINPINFRNQKKGIIIVSLAGPLANFLTALICSILISLLIKVPVASQIVEFFYYVITYAMVMNIGLMVFNLIPIPPLDGSKVLMEILPPRYRYQMYRIERYSGIILLVLVWTGVLTPVLVKMQTWVVALIELLTSFI